MKQLEEEEEEKFIFHINIKRLKILSDVIEKIQLPKGDNGIILT